MGKDAGSKGRDDSLRQGEELSSPSRHTRSQDAAPPIDTNVDPERMRRDINKWKRDNYINLE